MIIVGRGNSKIIGINSKLRTTKPPRTDRARGLCGI